LNTGKISKRRSGCKTNVNAASGREAALIIADENRLQAVAECAQAYKQHIKVERDYTSMVRTVNEMRERLTRKAPEPCSLRSGEGLAAKDATACSNGKPRMN
jgi:hypothetical protein